MHINKITFGGNAGKDAVSAQTQSGLVYTKFSICNNFKYKEKETQTWVNVIGWGNIAEWMLKIKKGQNITVYGALGISEFKGNEGQTLTNVQITAEWFQIGERPPQQQMPEPVPPQAQQGQGMNPGNVAPGLDQIPF